MAIAKDHLDLILKSKEVTHHAKHKVGLYRNRINANISDLSAQLPEMGLAVTKALSLDNTLQLQNIQSMLAHLPNTKRDEVERYIEAVYHAYKQN